LTLFPGMKFSSIFTLTTVAALTLAATSAYADQIGDKAKALNISEWVKGQQVDVTDGKNVYVVEFWATWCPPCRKSIPHLTELQKEYKDKNVVFVGVSTEDLKTVQPFVEKQGDDMNYTVAVDDANKTSKNYMTAFDQHGIPTAFIVNKDGRIAWVGHPMSLDEVIGKVVDGTYDLEKAIKEDELRAKKANLLTAFGKSTDKEELTKIAKEYIGLTEKDAESLSTLAENAFDKEQDEIAELALAAMTKIGDDAALQAKDLKDQAMFSRLLCKYKEAQKGSKAKDASDEQKAAKAKESKEFAKQITEYCSEHSDRILYATMTTSSELGENADTEFLIKLIDLFDEKSDGDTGLPFSTDVYRVIVYLQGKDLKKAEELEGKALESIKDESTRKSVTGYIERIKAQSNK